MEVPRDAAGQRGRMGLCRVYIWGYIGLIYGLIYMYRDYMGFTYIGIYMKVIFKVSSHPKIKLHQHMPIVCTSPSELRRPGPFSFPLPTASLTLGARSAPPVSGMIFAIIFNFKPRTPEALTLNPIPIHQCKPPYRPKL